MTRFAGFALTRGKTPTVAWRGTPLWLQLMKMYERDKLGEQEDVDKEAMAALDMEAYMSGRTQVEIITSTDKALKMKILTHTFEEPRDGINMTETLRLAGVFERDKRSVNWSPFEAEDHRSENKVGDPMTKNTPN